MDSGAAASGTTVTDGGSLNVSSGGTLAGHTLIQDGGHLSGTNITNHGNLEFHRDGTDSFGGDISGSGGITKTGGGTQTLTGTIDQAKGFTVEDGTLDLNGGRYSADGDLVTLRGSSGVRTVLFRNGASASTGGAYFVADATKTGHIVFDQVSLDATSKVLVEAKNGSELNVDVIDSTLAGNLLYRDTSTGLIRLTRSRLTGVIDPADMSIDRSSTWTMTGNSELRDLFLSGTIDFQAPVSTFAPKNLTVRSLAGDGGTLILNQVLSDGSVQGDRLTVDGGKVTGKTFLAIRNYAGLGAQTQGDGLLVVEAKNGADTTAGTTRDGFALKDPVYAGAYEYRLKAQDAKGTGQNWYLTSSSEKAPGTLMYRPAAASLASTLDLTSIMTREAMLRATDRPGLGAAPSLDQPRGWMSVMHRSVDASGSGETAPQYKASMSGITGGVDIWRHQNRDGGLTRAGLYGALLSGDGDAHGKAGGIDDALTARLRQNVSVAGAHVEHRAPSGAYVKAAAQASLNKGKVSGSDSATVRGSGTAASVEVGKTFLLSPTVSVEPQAQVIYQNQQYKSVGLAGDTTARLNADDNVSARLGMKFGWSPQGQQGATQVTFSTDLWHRNGKQNVEFSKPGVTNSRTAADFGGTSVAVGVGLETRIDEKWSLNGAVGYQRSIDGAKSEGVTAQIGIKIKF